MNTLLTEPSMIELMRQEHAKAHAKAEELWTKLKEAEEAMAPHKAVYDKLVNEWSDAHRIAQALDTLVKSQAPTIKPLEAA